MMTKDERALIEDAVRNALCWGTGILSSCREALEDAGYQWTEDHEAYIFATYVEGGNR